MQTDLSKKAASLLRGLTEELYKSSASWIDRPKPLGPAEHEAMVSFLREAPITSLHLAGRGIHRPWIVTLDEGFDVGLVTCSKAIFKTIRSIEETDYYNRSTDPAVTSPEREVAAYSLDRAIGFNLVPPTTTREVFDLGFGAIQAWVNAPLAIDWYESGYDYRKDYENPWLHRLCAFDFLCGNLDRHAGNFIFDSYRRVYAIDNGYSFVKNDYRHYFKNTVGRKFYNHPIHPTVLEEIARIQENAIISALRPFGFRAGEVEGVLQRLAELKQKKKWDIEDGKWGRT